MSRLIVKNLPNKVTEEKLRTTFSSKGILTDVQLKFTKDGKFRNFAFIGYKNQEETESAIKYFNGTYIGASKITVETCADLGDKTKPRAWSKHAPDSSAYQKIFGGNEKDTVKSEKENKKEKKKQKKVNSLLEKYNDDPKFQEFLRVHKRNSVGTWNNDSVLELGKLYSQESKIEDVESKDLKTHDVQENFEVSGEETVSDKVALKKGLSDLDYLKAKKAVSEGEKKETEENKKEPKEKLNFFTVKLSGLPYKAKKKDVKQFLAPLKPKSLRIPPKVKCIAYAGFATEKEMKQALNKHKSFYSGHQINVHKHDKKHVEPLEENLKWKEQKTGLEGEETVAESGRLFVRNLAYSVTEDDLEEMFAKYGPLTEVTVPVDRITRKVKGFAFVTFMLPEHAVKAFSELDGSTFQGRLLHLIPGKAKVSADGEDGEDEGGGNFKKKKEKAEKAKAGSSHNWNTLFLGGSAVADLMSEQYGVDKTDVVLGDGKQSAAVRLALGETQIVAQTREFLEEQGIKLDAFSRPPSSRSKTTLLVKNLPVKTPVEEIRDLFSAHGEIGRLVMPPSGITAVIEFQEPSEARKAFTRLAYTKFHHTPLYLEWAPEDTFTTSLADVKTSDAGDTAEDKDDTEEGEEEEAEEGGTLFVKNLNFSTTEEGLREHFSPSGKLHSVTVATKKEPKSGDLLSMGFGFVQFMRKASADRAMKTLQHSRLDDHCLELKRSNRAETSNSVKSSRKQTSSTGQPTTKILVRNIPFQANKREVEDIFKTFGELTAVRLPKKMAGTGPHRGFAFIDFATKSDAKKAFEALCHSTHLYGRRLVLEWAAQEETLDDLRRKTAEHFHGDEPRKKNRKIDVLDTVPDDE